MIYCPMLVMKMKIYLFHWLSVSNQLKQLFIMQLGKRNVHSHWWKFHITILFRKSQVMTMLELNSTCPIQSLVYLIEYFVGQIRLEYFLNCINESSFVCLFSKSFCSNHCSYCICSRASQSLHITIRHFVTPSRSVHPFLMLFMDMGMEQISSLLQVQILEFLNLFRPEWQSSQV